MEGACPGEPIRQDRGLVAQHMHGDALDALRHLGGGTTGEGHQQDAARIGAFDDEMRDAMSQRVRLARAGPCDNQQRARYLSAAVFDGRALLGVELGEVIETEGRIMCDVHRRMEHRFRFVRKNWRNSLS
jgi:hypothetical protein